MKFVVIFRLFFFEVSTTNTAHNLSGKVLVFTCRPFILLVLLERLCRNVVDPQSLSGDAYNFVWHFVVNKVGEVSATTRILTITTVATATTTTPVTMPTNQSPKVGWI